MIRKSITAVLLIAGLHLCALPAQASQFARMLNSSGPDITTGLVAYYPLNEASGNAIDASGNSRTMTQAGTVGVGSGTTANSRGPYTTSNYFSITNSAFNPTVSWEFTGWVYLTTLTGDTDSSIMLGQDNNVSGTRQFDVYAYNAFLTRCNAELFKATDSSQSITGAATPTTGAWYFVDAYHDVATLTFGISLNNGAFVTKTYTGSLQATTATPVTLGRRLYPGFPGNVNGFIGKLRWYTGRNLSSTVRTYLYNGGTFSTAP